MAGPWLKPCDASREDDTVIDDPENKVSKFYNTVGWEKEGEITEDAKRWEDLREHAAEYVSKCRLRVLRHIPEQGINILDMASGPIQYREYLEYSRNFRKRHCVDLSSGALEQARKKIGDHGVFLHGSFFDIPFEENFFDCAISLHTIYHMNKDRQEEAVRKLVSVVKPGRPVIIVYSNPRTAISTLGMPVRRLKQAFRTFRKGGEEGDRQEEPALYFYAYPLEWWDRFSDVAAVKILPWRSLSSAAQKRLIPNNKIGEKILRILFNLEEKFPVFFSKYFQYPMIVLTKRQN
jgi:ubiquinone/menaquinone biosynthesis C-methylase UbiE